ncbi:MAG TPA: hypothetical protein ENI92_04115, partial [Bacteroidetes bacterium]|nr:hypothetical protein [Bacteroidota bacterium]
MRIPGRRSWCAVALALAAFALSATAAEVVVDGYGSDRAGAVSDAQRNAVATVVGQYIEGSSLVANFALVSDRILSSTQGYLTSFQVIEEGAGPAGYHVRARAVVETKSIRDDINAIAVLRASRGNPRFIVVPDPNPLSEAFRISDPAVGETQKGIIEYLSERQFEVIQAPMYSAAVATGSPGMLKDLSLFGAGLGAEYAVYFSVLGREQGAGRTFKKAMALVDLSVVHTGSYRIVAQVEGRAEASDRAGMEFAYRKAARSAAKEAAGKALDLVLADWSRAGSTAG